MPMTIGGKNDRMVVACGRFVDIAVIVGEEEHGATSGLSGLC